MAVLTEKYREWETNISDFLLKTPNYTFIKINIFKL